MATVDIQNTAKSFGSTRVIRNVSIDIRDGEFVVLVGPSGCGKSTLLRMIAGLESIDSGEISIGGRCVNGLPPKERDIAMVFQVVEPTGSETHLIVDAGGTKLTCVLRERVSVRAGDSLRLGADAANLHLFGAESGERLVLAA